MRKIILLFVIFLVSVCSNWATSQSIPPSGGVSPCWHCVPPGWTITSSSPDISNKVSVGGDNKVLWSPQLMDPPSGNITFISGLHDGGVHENASTTISGLTVDSTYTIDYHLITSKTVLNGNPRSLLAKKGLMILKSGNNEITQTTDFVPGVNTDKWVHRSLSFVAKATTATVTLTQVGDAFDDLGAYVGWDFAGTAVKKCNAGVDQVSLSSHSASTTCPTNKFDLNSLLVGQTPPDIEVMWFKNPNHTWIKYLSPQAADPGTYYAFYYDTVNHCYNTDNSTAVVTVTGVLCPPCNAGTDQAILSTNKIKNICPATLVDLKPLVTNVAPPGSAIVFYSTPNHAPGTMIPEIQMTGKIYVYTSGTYYAFFYDQINECFNTDNSIAAVDVTITECPLPCKAGTKQVTLKGDKASTKCPTNKIDLNTLITSIAPDGAAPVWFKNPNHSGPPYATPQEAEAGTYYAFYYDAVNDCYNTNDSHAKVVVTNVLCPPCDATTNQVVLSASTIKNVCPSKVVNLKPLYENAVPNGATLVFYTTPDHQPGTLVPEVVINGQGKINVSVPGTYYAFFFDPVHGCFNTDNSNGKVTVVIDDCLPVCNAGTDQVVISGGAGTLYCYKPLHNLVNNIWPGLSDEQKSMVVWYDNPNHAGNPIADPTQVGIGTYYAFYFDEENDCYNTDNSSAIIVLTLEGQVQLTANNLTASCPEQTVNLNNALGPDPLTEHLVWFTNPTHTGNPVADPTQAPANTYYAFYHYVGIFDGNSIDCWNTDNSSAQVIVTTNVCADMVQLSVKVNLQGAMHANLPQMRNDLQIYDGVGLLPQTDPYGGGKTVPGINNLAAAGTVVDWIKVEVRSAANPANILESQSLILRPNGDMTNADLTVPKFSPQAEPIRIVIKHRNHVAIMSNSIATFGVGPVSYDFTTALAQAYNDGSASDQMKLVNGVWCMINGDPNQNLAVENQDINQTRNSFNQGILDVYSTRDLNMNGVLENLDMNIQRNRFNGNCFSILINY